MRFCAHPEAYTTVSRYLACPAQPGIHTEIMMVKAIIDKKDVNVGYGVETHGNPQQSSFLNQLELSQVLGK